MIAVGNYSDALRALGRFLDMARASEIIIVDQPEFVEVSWRGKRGVREEKKYRSWELDALRTWARMMRGFEENGPRFSMPEAIRMLGCELDIMKLENITVVETADGWWFSGYIEGTEVRQNFANADLMAKAQRYHQQRLAEEAPQKR